MLCCATRIFDAVDHGGVHLFFADKLQRSFLIELLVFCDGLIDAIARGPAAVKAWEAGTPTFHGLRVCWYRNTKEMEAARRKGLPLDRPILNDDLHKCADWRAEFAADIVCSFVDYFISRWSRPILRSYREQSINSVIAVRLVYMDRVAAATACWSLLGRGLAFDTPAHAEAVLKDGPMLDLTYLFVRSARRIIRLFSARGIPKSIT